MLQMFNIKRFYTKINTSRIIAVILILALSASMCSCSSVSNDFDGKRFAKTRIISVLSDGSDPSLEKYIHDSVLEDCNIDVRFVSDSYYYQIYGVVPDIAYSYDLNSITTFYKMDSVLDISPILDEYTDVLIDLDNVLSDNCIYNNADKSDEIWYLASADAEPKAKVTFIRADWLEELGLDSPSTKDELYNCLIAFRDNASLLLGDDASEMIPFFIDSEPNLSCKPLFDSFYDTSIVDEEFYENGYCRATQNGYADGLAMLNSWYLEGLLPEDFSTIIPGSKESYEPIENGYVGAFCAEYDYLYRNGEDSIYNALHDKCGEDAEFIAVNTFENSEGDYTCWQEDYQSTSKRYIYMPSTCAEPLACLVYLNWLSKTENADDIKANASKESNVYNYLLTLSEAHDVSFYSNENAQFAKAVADNVVIVSRPVKCVKYGPSIFTYVETDIDIKTLYPDSLKLYSCASISAPEGCFDKIASDAFEVYVNSGAGVIVKIRSMEWNKVMIEGDMWPW